MVPACVHILRYRPHVHMIYAPTRRSMSPPSPSTGTHGLTTFFSESPFALHSDLTSRPRCREQYVVLCEVPLLMFLQGVTVLRGWKNAGPDSVSVIYGSPWW